MLLLFEIPKTGSTSLSLPIRLFGLFRGHPGAVAAQGCVMRAYLQKRGHDRSRVQTPKAGQARHTAPEER